MLMGAYFIVNNNRKSAILFQVQDCENGSPDPSDRIVAYTDGSVEDAAKPTGIYHILNFRPVGRAPKGRTENSQG